MKHTLCSCGQKAATRCTHVSCRKALCTKCAVKHAAVHPGALRNPAVVDRTASHDGVNIRTK